VFHEVGPQLVLDLNYTLQILVFIS